MKPGRFSRSQRVYCTYEACVIPSPALTLFLFVQSGGGSVPPMKVVTPGASRLKAAQGQAGSPDKGKHGKQRAEYMRIQAQQQVSLGASATRPRGRVLQKEKRSKDGATAVSSPHTMTGQWLPLATSGESAYTATKTKPRQK